MTEKYENWQAADKTKLDTQWEEQSNLYRYWAKKMYSAQKEVDDQKKELERLSARLDREARKKRAGDKFTEAVIKTDVLLNKEYIEAEDLLSDLQEKVSEIKVELEAIHIRKAALENLVKLYGQEYFSIPIISDSEKERFSEEKTKETIKRKMKKEN